MILHLALAHAKGTRLGDRPAQSRHLAAQAEPCDRATAGPNASSGVVQKPASNIQRNAASVGTRQVDPRGQAWRWLCQRSFRSPGSAMACSFDPWAPDRLCKTSKNADAHNRIAPIPPHRFRQRIDGSRTLRGPAPVRHEVSNQASVAAFRDRSSTFCDASSATATCHPFGRDDTCGLLQTRSNPRW
jgi:hypothetical protein